MDNSNFSPITALDVMEKTIKGLIKHGKRILTPESVVDFLRIQKNELLGGDE